MILNISTDHLLCKDSEKQGPFQYKDSFSS